MISGALTAETDDLLPVPAGATLNTLVVLNRRLGWLPAEGGNKADLFDDYDESIAAMARAVRTAEQYVHVEFYIMSWDSTTKDFFEALAEVAARGVKVRLMFDHIGTARHSGLSRHDQEAQGDRDRVAPNAAGPAVEGKMATA